MIETILNIHSYFLKYPNATLSDVAKIEPTCTVGPLALAC